MSTEILLILIGSGLFALVMIAYQIGYALGHRDGWRQGYRSGHRFGDLKVWESEQRTNGRTHHL